MTENFSLLKKSVQNLDFLTAKLNFMTFEKKYPDFGAKNSNISKSKVCQNLIFGQKLDKKWDFVVNFQTLWWSNTTWILSLEYNAKAKRIHAITFAFA